jgi:DoxX-like family
LSQSSHQFGLMGMDLKMTRRKSIAYWATTVFVSSVMGISGGLALSHAAPFMKALAHLGYPRYFSNLLGIGKIAGVVVLLAPGMPRLKEWAYVGCAITILSACYSHYSSGDGLLALEPLVTFGALVASYGSRPKSRRLQIAAA